MSFKGKVVLITGSSGGIGASTAVLFSKEGAHVIIVGRDETKLENVREKCLKYGQKPLVIKADVSKDGDSKRIVEETLKMFGRIDVLVNNAGVFGYADITNNNFMDVYDRVVDVNLRGAIFITHIVIPHLIKSKGNIINISSIAGSRTIGIPNIISYCVSKAGLSHFTSCLALNLASYGVRVNTISPGPVGTDIIDQETWKFVTLEQLGEATALKRISEPEEIADLILFLASDKARGITGSNFLSDNGYLIKK